MSPSGTRRLSTLMSIAGISATTCWSWQYGTNPGHQRRTARSWERYHSLTRTQAPACARAHVCVCACVCAQNKNSASTLILRVSFERELFLIMIVTSLIVNSPAHSFVSFNFSMTHSVLSVFSEQLLFGGSSSCLPVHKELFSFLLCSLLDCYRAWI